MKLTTAITGIRAVLADRRTRRTRRRRLERELAAFVTPAERAELDLLLARHTAEETREVEEILNRQARDRAMAGHRIGLHQQG